MAAVDLVILSSSPRGPADFVVTPPGQRQQSAAISLSASPPDLPSLSELIQRKPVGVLKSGSRAAQVPEGAITGFASAASLIRERRLSLTLPVEEAGKGSIWDFPHDEPAEKPVAPVKKATKRAPKPKADGEAVPKKPRKPRTKVTDKAKAEEDAEKGEALIELTVVEPVDKADAPATRSAQDDPPAPAESKKPRKPRARKEKDETQTKLKKGRVTKPKASGKDDGEEGIPAVAGPKKRRKTNKVSEHFSPIEVGNERPEAGEHQEATEKGLAIEEALRRRTDWTPPKDTKPTEPESVMSQKGTEPTKVSQEPLRCNFATLITDFAYGPAIAEVPAISPTRQPSGEALTKRRRIELVDPVLPVQNAPPPAQGDPDPAKMTKQPKKKARTITELATAYYKSIEPAGVDTPTVSAFFAPRVGSGADKPVTDDPPDVGKTKPRKRAPREKPSAKGGVKEGAKVKKATAKSNKKAEPVKPKLLSPTSAVHRMNGQDLLFGTSSQLAREESPTFIRDLQQAIRESEAAVDVEQASVSATVNRTGSLALVKASRGLWSAAARDFDDELLAAEERETPDTRPAPNQNSAGRATEPGVAEQEVIEIADDEADSMVPGIRATDVPGIRTCEMQKQGFDSHDSMEIESLDEQPPPHAQDDGWTVLDDIEPKAAIPTTTPAGAYGSSLFLPKPSIETARAPIEASLLQHRSPEPSTKHGNPEVQGAPMMLHERVVLQPLPINVNVPKPLLSSAEIKRPKKSDAPSKCPNAPRPNTVTGIETVTEPQLLPTKRPRGRPRKNPLPDSAATSPAKKRSTKTAVLQDPPATPPKLKNTDSEWTNIDEIEDSEQEFTPSPPRRANPTASPPLQLVPPASPAPSSTATAHAQTANGKPDQAALQAHLFPQITHTIKSAPATTNPQAPSWHEKMLLYDPIVLEDLTAWLNEQGLRLPGKTGKDGVEKMEELKPWVVQKWCEEKSVCCLWKEGLRGGVRNRY